MWLDCGADALNCERMGFSMLKETRRICRWFNLKLLSVVYLVSLIFNSRQKSFGRNANGLVKLLRLWFQLTAN